MLRIRVSIVTSMVVFLSIWNNTVSAVDYMVDFNATWSGSSHPEAYPPGAHFSPLVGATHTDQVNFWDNGGIASAGIESMAETGSTLALRNEFDAAGDNADTTIITSGTLSSNTVSGTFMVNESHSLVTLVTMVAPSPDWFVGVHDLQLRAEGEWLSSLTVDLFAYDAGTDSGSNFLSNNNNTSPQDPIALLGDPFVGESTGPLGTFTFTLIPELVGDFDDSGNVGVEDLNLVLFNWNAPGTTLPEEWTNRRPSGNVGASKLDEVLFNWGDVVAVALAPEPTTGILAVWGIGWIMIRTRSARMHSHGRGSSKN